MTNERANELLAKAYRLGFINDAQVTTLKEEISMFPGGNIISILVRRNLITFEQGKALEQTEASTEAATPETANHDDMDMDFGSSAHDVSFEILSGPAATRQSASPSHDAIREDRRPAPGAARVAGDQMATAPRRSVSAGLDVARNALQQTPEMPMQGTGKPEPYIVQLLAAARERGSSDLHITPGKAPYMRLDGSLLFMDGAPLSPAKTAELCLSLLNAEQRQEFDARSQVDFSFSDPIAGRFRANVYQQRLGVEGAFRVIPVEVPTLSSLGLPDTLERLTTYPQGMVLVTGPGGSGKTSTVAAMIEHINRHRHDHIITVEDPVEYVFSPQNCQITQREVGTHTESFAHALRRALRQDPDVIMIGELRDLETTSISITAAETGHLVFGTLHTSSAVRTVARILDVYPPSQRSQICLMIAESLRGILSQQLIPRADNTGRVCAMEILLVTTGVTQVIKEGKTHQLISHMQSGRKLGMITMDDAILELLRANRISQAEAYQRAENKSLFTAGA